MRVDGIGWMSMSWMGQGVAVCRSLGACHPMKAHLFATYVPSFAVCVLPCRSASKLVVSAK